MIESRVVRVKVPRVEAPICRAKSVIIRTNGHSSSIFLLASVRSSGPLSNIFLLLRVDDWTIGPFHEIKQT